MIKLNFSQYAVHRGISKAAVTKAIQGGRITAHVDPEGKRFLFKEEADEQWDKNTNQNVGAPARDRAIEEEKKIEEQAPPEPNPIAPGDPRIPPLYQSKAIKEAFFARAAKLKYETDLGKVVEAEEVKKTWHAIISIARTKILGVPSKIRQRMPEMTNDQYLLIESIIRESLEDLSSGK